MLAQILDFPGLRLGLGGWRGMHRIAVPLSDGRHRCKARQQWVWDRRRCRTEK